jgi:hypothetical protein
MVDGKGFREYIRSELAKLKPMTFNEKRLYIWEYYKLHMLVLIIAVVLIGGLLNTFVFNPPREHYLYIAWMGPPIIQDDLTALAQRLDPLVDNIERQRITVNSYAVMPGELVSGVRQQQLAAMVQTASIDLVIITRNGVRELIDMGWIRPISELPGNPMSVSLRGSPLFEELGICTEDLFVTVMINTRNSHRIMGALDKLTNGTGDV